MSIRALNSSRLTGQPARSCGRPSSRLAFGPTGRGPAYGGGRIYAYGQTTLYAVDAASGEPVESFGTGGTLDVVNEALDVAYPDQYPGRVDPVSLGYFSLTTPPTYYDDTLFVGLAHGDSHIRGGLLAAVDGALSG